MRRELGMLVALLVLCGSLWFSNGDFVGAYNVRNVTRQISMLGILSIGSAFVIITGGIDLSVGSLVGLTGVILAKFSSHAEGGLGHPLWLGIVVAMSFALLIGLVQGLLITRVNLQPFIVTLGFMLMLRGVSQTIVRGGNISFSEFREAANATVLSLSQQPTGPGDGAGSAIAHLFFRALAAILTPSAAAAIPALFLVLIVVAVTSAYLLHFTVFGRYVFAIGGNRDAAQYSGIPVKNVEMLTYVISAGLAGFAGIYWASYIGQMDHNVGVAFELSAIAACVLGGCSLRGGEGTIIGVLIGTALMKIIEDGLDLFQIIVKDPQGHRHFWKPDDNWRNIVIGAVILIAVILDQVVHVVQRHRRTRSAGSAANASPPTPVA